MNQRDKLRLRLALQKDNEVRNDIRKWQKDLNSLLRKYTEFFLIWGDYPLFTCQAKDIDDTVTKLMSAAYHIQQASECCNEALKGLRWNQHSKD